MNKIILVSFTIWLLVGNIFGQERTPVSTGESVNIKSVILNEDRKVLISLPNNYEKSDQRYPVIYVLDGESNFPIVEQACKILADNERIPSSIVIGVTSGDRNRDFTTKIDTNFPKPDFMNEAGGADKFLDHLEKELVPFVDKYFRTAPYRMIVGHSLGGIFAWHSLASRPQFFQSYLILDASVFWNNGSVVKEVIEYFQKNPTAKTRIFWGRDRIPREVWFPDNTKLLNFWEKSPPKNVHFNFYEMEDETHSTLVFPLSYIGLRTLFSDYQIKLSEKITLTEITSHYAALSSEFGYEVKIPESFIDNVARQFLTLKNFKDAIAIYQIGLKSYPPNFTMLDGLAEAYEADNQPKLALETYQKADALTDKQPASVRANRQKKMAELTQKLKDK